MRRFSDDDIVAIAPPEFRDIDTTTPSTSATVSTSGTFNVIPFPAPPPEFRDLTPSPGDPLSYGLTPHMLPPFQSYHHGKTFIRKTVWDFADRVSFRIVSEAVIIATVLPEAGSCTITDFRKGGNLGTGSFENTVLSTSSSWEYLSQPEGDRSHESTKGVDHIVVDSHNNDGFPGKNETPSNSVRLNVPTSQHRLPIPCDIYSQPIDSIQPPTPPLLLNPPPPLIRLRPRTHHYRQQDLKRHSLQVLEHNQDSGFSISAKGHATAERVQSFHNIELGSIEQSKERRCRHWIKKLEKNNNHQLSTDEGQRSLPELREGTNKNPSQNSVHESNRRGDNAKKKGRGNAFLNIFRKVHHKEHKVFIHSHKPVQPQLVVESPPRSSLTSLGGQECPMTRALPTPPVAQPVLEPEPIGFRSPEVRLTPGDVPSSLQEVKDCGWYWGPLGSEGAEDFLRGEPDGSFIVRDSSDSRYIFSLTFKLNGLIRHVRIEHDHGNFSFGPLTRFKASTIVDFVEKAVAHSRSGRYLFFLHRRPVLGPMRVQLLHPYSRFRHPRSLQHMSRFVILKHVRRDLVDMLGLPKMLVDYLKAPQYYFEPTH